MSTALSISTWPTSRTLFPGVLACAVVAAAATFLAEHYGAPVMLFALLLGLAMNFLSAEGACKPGIEFTARTLLRLGVALLGLRITLSQIADLGWQPIVIVVLTVALTIGVGDAGRAADGFPDPVRPAQRRRDRDLRRLGRDGAGGGAAEPPDEGACDALRRRRRPAVVGATSAKWKAITGNFIREGYGLSETSPVVSFNPMSISDFSGTTGLPMPGTDIKLLDEDGAEAEVGAPEAFGRRNSRSTSLRRLYISRSYSHGSTLVLGGCTTGMKPRSSASWIVSLPE